MTDAVIYARQSEDKTGEAAAVERQLSLCRDLCADRGWAVATEYVDNDRSATSGAARPAFERMLADRPRRVVVWHIDRLVRLTRDLERVIDTGANVHAVRAGHLDLSNPAGRAVARTVTAWATYEGEQKADRQRAANRQRAQSGAARWSRRPFGFDRAGSAVVIVEAEAELIREAYASIFDGGTIAAVVRRWDALGVTSTVGGPWNTTSVRRALTNPRLVGRTVYRGEDMGQTGPSIVEADAFDRMTAKMSDPRRRTAPSTQVKYLLSGLVRCGACDAPMFATNTSTRTAPKYSVYRCLSCSRVRKRERVDEVVEGVVLARLSRPDASRLLAQGVDVADLQSQATELRERRDGLARLLADGLLGAEAVRGQAQRLSQQITDLERRIEAALGDSPLTGIVGADDVAQAWHAAALLQRRAIIDTLMTVHIEAAGKGVRFDPTSVRITPKENR